MAGRETLILVATLALLALAYAPVFLFRDSSLLPVYWGLLGLCALVLAWLQTRGWGRVD